MPPDHKRPVEIEALLRWSYQDELPKREISSADSIWDQIAEYGARGGIDAGHGAAQRYPHHGVPHPDALAIEKAVSALPDAAIDWAIDGEAIMGDLLVLADPRPPAKSPNSPRGTRVGWWAHRQPRNGKTHQRATSWISEVVRPPRAVLLVRSLRTAALVIMHARMGTRPDWHEEPPRAVPVVGERGRPRLIGEIYGKRRYSEGAHCPLRYEPSPLSIAQARADYVAWWRGLAELVGSLLLIDHSALPPSASPMPWREPPLEPVVWTLGGQPGPVLPLKPQRPAALMPLRRALARTQ